MQVCVQLLQLGCVKASSVCREEAVSSRVSVFNQMQPCVPLLVLCAAAMVVLAAVLFCTGNLCPSRLESLLEYCSPAGMRSCCRNKLKSLPQEQILTWVLHQPTSAAPLPCTLHVCVLCLCSCTLCVRLLLLLA